MTASLKVKIGNIIEAITPSVTEPSRNPNAAVEVIYTAHVNTQNLIH